MRTLAFLLLMAPLAAQADTITVSNGDQLNGRVDKLESGKLFVRTEYAGTIQIDWRKVLSIEAEGRYTVRLEAGRQYVGAMRLSPAALAIESEDVVVRLARPEVVALVRHENSRPPGFWETIEGSAGLGYSFNHGNTEQTQASLTAEGDYRRTNYQLRADLKSIFSSQEEAETTSRHALNARYDRYLSDRAFAFALTGFERNDRQQLNLRSRFGGGFGWKLINNSDEGLDLLGGFTYTNEQFRSQENQMLPRDSTGEGLFGFEWETTRLPILDLSTRLTAHPNLVQTGRYRLEYDTTASIPLMRTLTWSISLFDRYDSDPPRGDIEKNDYGMVSTFGFSF